MSAARARLFVVDALALTALLLTLLWVWQPSWQALRHGEVYVSPEGWDGHIGATPQTAVRTLQRAADLAAPGETVVILPGSYAGDIRIRRGGEPGRPVVFRARDPGTVTISGAAPPQALASLAWQDEGGGIRSAQPPWPVHHLRWGDATLFHVAWGGLQRLRELTSRAGAAGAFAWERETGRLHVFLPGDGWIREPLLITHRPVPTPREWGNIRSANVWVEADHVVFDGLRFDFGVGAGVLLWNASDVVVRDCVFSGADTGIGAQPRIGGAHRLTIRHSLYHNYPQYHWQHGWLPWREVYASYSSSSLLSLAGREITVANSLVAHGGDAIRVSPPASPSGFGALVEGNLLYRGTDDAIEAEGDVHDVHIRGNVVYDHHQNLGLSPVWHGPVRVEHNRFLHPHGGLNGSQVKLLNPEADSAGKAPRPIRNITIQDNVFVGRWLAWSNAPVAEVSVERNVFALQREDGPDWPQGVLVADETRVVLPADGYADPGQDARWWAAAAGGSRAPARPGPRWLDWGSHPATRDIASTLVRTGWSARPAGAP